MEKNQLSVSEMKSTCRLMFCSKLYCSIDFAVGYCRCRNKDSDTKTENVKIVDTNEGKIVRIHTSQ